MASSAEAAATMNTTELTVAASPVLVSLDQVSPLGSFYRRFGKVWVDRLLAVGILLVALPVMLAVAAMVRLSLGRGVLLRQDRIGVGGRRITVLKFRTMAPCRRKATMPIDFPDRRINHKHPADPRMSPTGKVLRKFSLDELPQLVNVVRGDMSLVGPRPELPSIVEGYSPWQHHRHLVRPGLTGLWQVTARDVPLHEATHLDLDYIRRMSFFTDIGIMLKTLVTVVRGGGH